MEHKTYFFEEGVSMKILTVIFGVPLAAITLNVILSMVISPAWDKGLFYLRSEDRLIGMLSLIVLFWIALGVRWLGAFKVSKGMMIGSLVLFAAWMGTVASYQTTETKKMIAVAEQFVPPAGSTRSLEGNSDDIQPAPVIGCLDLSMDGCPSIHRTWVTEGENSLERADLEQIISESGWRDDVSIEFDTCDIPDERHFRCSALGEVEGYNVAVDIVEFSKNVEFRLYITVDEDK